MNLSNRHQKTLERVFTNPVQAGINWRDIEQLFIAIGCEISQRNGSRVAVYYQESIAVFHTPHPEKETNRGAIKNVRRYLESIGVTPQKH